MSSILKALKKLEDEKTIRKPDTLKIDAEILRGDVSRRFSPAGITIWAILLFVCGSSATYFLMKSDSVNTDGANQSASVEARLMPSASGSPVVQSPDKTHGLNIQVELTKSDKVISVLNDVKTDKNQLNFLKTPSLPSIINPATPTIKSELSSAITPAKQETANAIMPPSSSVNTPPLKVNGIAFQDESGDRVAIVNGISVSNGSLIDGAKVEDIQKDRVRFSYDGDYFDVALGRSNRK